MTCDSGLWTGIAVNVAVGVWNFWAGIRHLRAARQLARELMVLRFSGASVVTHLDSDKKEQQ